MVIRIITCKIKNMMKSKMTLIMLFFCLLVTISLTIVTISKHYSTSVNSEEVVEKLKGIAAIKENQQKYEAFTGIMDEVIIKKSVNNYQTLIKEFGEVESIPSQLYEVKINQFFPIDNFVLDTVKMTNKSADLMSLTESNLTDFYTYRKQAIEQFVSQSDYDNKTKEKIMAMNDLVTVPFRYEYGLGTDDLFFRYFGILIWLLIILLAVISVPIFAGNNENQSIYIIKPTKYGQNKLALAKIIAVLIITSLAFISCIGIFLIASNSCFGFRGGNTSFQMLFGYSKSLFDGTSFEAQLFICISGFITLWATISFTLMVSASSKSSLTPMISVLVMLFIPTFISIIYNGSGFLNRLIYSLPSSSVGLKNSIDITLGRFDFMSIMGHLIWVPCYVVIMAFIFTCLFLILTPYCYKKKEV